MECKICLESFDTNLHKPMCLQPCGHTICKESLDKLDKNECPFCKEIIISKKPNFNLIEIIEEKSINLLKLNIQNKLKEIELKKTKYFKQFNESNDKKNQNIKKIKEKITNEIANFIQIL